MKRSLRIAFAGTLALAAVSLDQGPAAAAPSCPASPDVTLSDFPAFSYELTPQHRTSLDALANKVVSLTKSGKPVRKIRIVGHAAVWGSSDYQKTSEYRAAVVQAELTSRFANLGVNYGKTQITTEGMATACPVATNSTQAGRAANRRVEVWITAASKPVPPPPPPAKKSLNQLLSSVQKSSSNPTTQCLAGKLLDPASNDSFLPNDGLQAFMSRPIQKVGVHGYSSFERDLGPWLDSQLKRIHDVPTKQSVEQRFQSSFMNAQNSLIDGVRALKYLDCYDKRAKPVKNHIIEQTKRARSLYSCPVIKKLVEDATKNACTA
jgi:outer membrane protein OmpA-like peptidoglycan-associated protein